MKRTILFFALILVCSFSLFAQKGTLKGTVVDKKTKESLVGATIVIKGTTIGTVVNLDGKFELPNVAAGKQTVVTSLVGYSPVESSVVIVANQVTNLDLAMQEDLIGLHEVVVTGVVNPKSALESSVAITSLKPKSLEMLGAINTAEVFKSIPGVHSESTGGEGNANISVRGIPISTGGSKFLQLHEDGLPVMQFGDITFGNADMFLRTDQTLARIEAIRGGSASTFASNSPAGIINFISKNGATAGGTIGMTAGLDYNEFRTDFDFGAPIGNGFSFNIGGFYRQGEGPRTCGFNGNMGGQIKANITKQYENGYVRVYLKHLDDKAISYMPMSLTATGTGTNPSYKSIAGSDVRNTTYQNSEFFNMLGIDANGNPRTTNISDGMHPVSNAIGTEFSFDIGEGWRIVNKNRLALTSGSFRTLFPTGTIGSADVIAKDILGSAYAPGYKFSYANGVNAGKTLSAAQLSGLNGNGLLQEVASFDVDINSLNNFTNDFNLSKKFDKVNLTFGYYNAYQQIAMYWDWQGYITDVSSSPKLVNVASADGSYYTENGVTSYGQWGLGRKYDMMYKINAPYANIGINVNDKINIDASIRYDFGKADGYYLKNKTAAIDVNSDGVISPVEAKSQVVDNTHPYAVNYNYGYLSYSLGANYKIDNNKALYGRVSRGGRANADRLLYSSFITSEGKTMSGLEADMVTQVEGGFKYNSPKFALMFTPFYSNINEQNADVTENKIYLMKFESYGAELEASTHLSNFTATAGAVFTKAKILESLDATEVGKTPRRVPLVMYNFNPSYSFGKVDLGLSFIGTTNVFSQNDNKIVLPGYVYVNAFASYNITKGLVLSANVNNLFNTMGLTEAESTTFVNNSTNYMRARSITGRTSKLSLTYSF
ncbi:TonB-dependent receptor [Paludibacter sp.]|uniref:TonB-dependent receptor n=1 Tax=Paludibacter sp. TaxID=1898105 RepID=UPI0013538E56|nr:TonB-dependent receptor [Paludibacter sp.]MTK52984.1 TonB-dependent receptor [Paludibacter sp.]